MSGMFNSCLGLSTLDVSGFDTSNVTDMCDMFWGCAKLTSLDISKFDTSKVTNMGGMFCACNKLTTLDVSGFNTSKVTDMSGMFASTNLSTLDVSGFDTSKVTDMMAMFSSRNLTELDLSSFDTSKVTKMDWMFSSNLRSLTLGENFKNVPEEAELYNDKGWVNSKDIATVVSGNGEYAVIENTGKNTYKRLPIVEETKLTYPTNIKVEYIKKYHQVRFTWDKVESADKYSIAVFLAGKWRVQTQNITDTTYATPKYLTPGKTYKVAIASRVDGKWDTANAVKNAVTVTIK
jgi:surface protein